MEAVTEITESQFLKKDLILTNVTDFLPSGNQFLPFFQTAINYCQWKQFILKLGHVVSPTPHYGSGDEFFVYWKQCSFIAGYFLQVGTVIEIRRKSILKTNNILASGH